MPRSILWMPKISWHSYDIVVVAVRQDHTSGVSVLKFYRPCLRQSAAWKFKKNVHIWQNIFCSDTVSEKSTYNCHWVEFL